MNGKHIIAIFICLLINCFAAAFSQNKIDSLQLVVQSEVADTTKIKAYMEIAMTYCISDPQKTIQYGDTVFKLATKINSNIHKGDGENLRGIGYWYLEKFAEAKKHYLEAKTYFFKAKNLGRQCNIYGNIAIIHTNWGENDSALHYLEKALNLAIEIKDTAKIAKSYLDKAAIQLKTGMYDDAVENTYTAINYYEKVNHYYGLTIGYAALGNSFSALKQGEMALKYYQEAERLAIENNYQHLLPNYKNSIGFLYYSVIQDYEKAHKYLQEAYQLSEGFNNINLQSAVSINLGNLFYYTNQHDSAIFYNEKGRELAKKLGNKYTESAALINSGMSYAFLRNYQKALENINCGLEMANAENYTNWKIIGLHALYRIDSLQGNYKVALAKLIDYYSIRDSIFNIEKQEKIAELQTRFDTEKKEKENALLRENNLQQEVTINRQKLLVLVFFVVAIGLITIVVVVIRSRMLMQLKNKELEQKNNEIVMKGNEILQQKEEILCQNELLATQNEKLKELDTFKQGLSDMIVHDLKSPLNTVISLTKQEEVKHAGMQMLNLVQNILDINKYETTSMELEPSEFVLSELVFNTCKQFNYMRTAKSIVFENTISDEITLFADANLIERVFVNIISNALKFTPIGGRIVFVAMQIENNFVQVEISDNGEGIPEDKIYLIFQKFGQVVARKSGVTRSTGLGLTFCKMAIEAHNGEIGVYSSPNKGTTVWFKIIGKRSDKPVIHNNEKETVIEKIPTEIKLKYSVEIEKLQNLQIFEVSSIRRVLNEINENNDALINWKKQMQKSLFAGNEQLFSELLNRMKIN